MGLHLFSPRAALWPLVLGLLASSSAGAVTVWESAINPDVPRPPGSGSLLNNTAFVASRFTLTLPVEVTAVVLMFGNPVDDGALMRLSVDYDVLDGFVVGGGVVMYLGLPSPVDTWNDNDRIFLHAKYSF